MKKLADGDREVGESSPDMSAPPVCQPAEHELIAYALSQADSVPLVPASRQRELFSGSFGRAAKRCLPLMLANQAGWLLLNPCTFTATWDGSEKRGSITIEYAEKRPAYRIAEDAFGNGALSFRVPYLFRTPPGWNMLARGPANVVKEFVCPLEGIIETDWAVATFTMNWKLTRPHTPITFSAGEPYCMIVPQRRYELERFSPVIEDIRDHAENRKQLKQWHKNRTQQLIRTFLHDNGQVPVEDLALEDLQYLRGRYPDGSKPEEHQTRLVLRSFVDRRSSTAQ